MDPQSPGGRARPRGSNYRLPAPALVGPVSVPAVALPLAAGMLYPHFVLMPDMGALLMSASTVIVALNAQLQRQSLQYPVALPKQAALTYFFNGSKRQVAPGIFLFYHGAWAS